MAFEHLRDSLTKGNLWLYILTALEAGAATPVEVKNFVQQKHGFAPAAITFYSVLYRLRREGLVRKSSDSFRSNYEITSEGKEELAKARSFLMRLGLQLEH